MQCCGKQHKDLCILDLFTDACITSCTLLCECCYIDFFLLFKIYHLLNLHQKKTTSLGSMFTLFCFFFNKTA